jgi:YVTN family beta-propeller protein
MRDLRTTIRHRRRALQHVALVASLGAVGVVAAEGCGGGTTTTTGSSSSSGSGGGTGGATASSTTSTTSTTTSTTSTTATTGTGGMMNPPFCPTAAKGTTRGAAIAITPDDKTLLSVNRDVGSVTVLSVDYATNQPVMTKVAELMVGGEPWQVAIDGCGTTGYVVLRKDQKVIEITGLGSATPKIGRSVSVGSEPTALALTPNNTKLYVSNWVDGTLTVVDPAAMAETGTVDLNVTLAATGLLGTVTARPALAHPRGIAITNNGDASDDDETVLVTEWAAQRTGPEDATGTNSDHNWKGLLYKVDVGTGTASSVDLPPIGKNAGETTGFKDVKNQDTGCFPNQVATVTIDGGFAYVTSTCASPTGPVGVFQKGSCTATAACVTAFGAGSVCNAGGVCTQSCAQDSDCTNLFRVGDCVLPAGTCKPTVDNAKTTTHPALTIVKLADGTATTTTLDKRFEDLGKTNALGFRSPLLPTDMAFIAAGKVGYITGEGSDAAFRVRMDASGSIVEVGAPGVQNFLDVRTSDKTIRLPIGMAVANAAAFAFVANDGTRDVTALDLGVQTVAGTAAAPSVVAASPAPTGTALSVLKGKRFFNTGLGRWSLGGQAWGSCAACHIDGLSDNVTWYFARGPRQTTSLDGTFASGDPTDQRILNWSAINDEVADFEGNVRGISGGVGALVTQNNKACTVATQATDCPSGVCSAATLTCAIGVADRINTATLVPPQQGLQGSSTDIGDPNGASAHPHSVIGDWLDITAWVQTIRSPRKPSNLLPADVTAGKALFSGAGQGNCAGCHSGAKWTISATKFYAPPGPNDTLNDLSSAPVAGSLSLIKWNTNLNGFLPKLFPATDMTKQFMRSGAPPAFEQMQCILRPVGTIIANGAVPTGVSDPMVGVLELRQDMKTGAQGAGATNANDFTVGFNPPSLLGMQVGAPFLHAGNARTLEEVFNDTLFHGHHTALNVNFALDATQTKQLVAYLLSIDESESPLAIPAKGAAGGDLCFSP